jgi:16S rRNA processing protein RimM
MTWPENLVLMGNVIGPHGLEGLLKIRSYAESEKSFLDAGVVYLGSDGAEVREYRVLSVRPHKKTYLLKLEHLASVEEAETHKGAMIFVPKESLTREDEDEFFWHELTGLEVVLDTGRRIGTLKEILPTGNHDIYVVREGKKEILLPAVREVVREIDLDKQRMVISPIEGLLELNEV